MSRAVEVTNLTVEQHGAVRKIAKERQNPAMAAREVFAAGLKALAAKPELPAEERLSAPPKAAKKTKAAKK